MAGRRMKLGNVQLRIMRVLWRHGRATAKQITADLRRSESIAHSTVQTLLRKLEAKGAVGHETEGRQFVFAPRVTEEEIVAAATDDLLRRLFGGSPAGLVAHLLERERITPRELARIREAIDGAEDKGDDR